MKASAAEIDAVLPQTQCGLCGYDGCMPYARALVNEGAAINLCPPGGVAGLKAIAGLLNHNPEPFIAEMEKSAKPRQVAVIRENECIGCTLCIQACPVDAILGSAKTMHTVITVDCTGCELCLAPCPMDCIDITITLNESQTDIENKALLARNHYNKRLTRLGREKETRRSVTPVTCDNTLEGKKSFVKEAIERANVKRRALLK